jgi:hypothetical protein
VAARGETIPLCTERCPTAGASPIRRIGQDVWQIAPVVYHNGSFWRIDDREFLLLIGAPEALNESLAKDVYYE